MNDRRRLLIAAGVIAILATAGTAYALHERRYESTDDAQVECDVVALSVRVPGLVVNVPVKDNAPVKRGDLIAEIDPTDFEARLAQVEAELAQARAQAEHAEADEAIALATARGGHAVAQAVVTGSSFAARGASAEIASAMAAVERAEVDDLTAAADLRRYETLRADDVVSVAKLEEVRAGATRARVAVTQARATLAIAQEQASAVQAKMSEARGRMLQNAPIETQIAAARAETAFARARIGAAEAAVTLARSQLAATRVVAPADGLLTNLSLHPGVLAAVGTPVGLLVPQTPYVVANFKETQLGVLRPGQTVNVTIDALASRTFTGKVDTIAGGTQGRFSLLPADNASGNFVKVVQRVPVRIQLTERDAALLPGLSAEVSIAVR